MRDCVYIPRINQGGNFCGHVPARPQFGLKEPIKTGFKGIPRVLSLCAERLSGYYNRPRSVLPSLDLANKSTRQQRSERRESCIVLLKALLKHTDLTSLRVGIPTKDGFVNLTVKYIAASTGMKLKRVGRALKDLKAAGLITVAQQRELKADGSWCGLAAVKAISKHLFGCFGLAVMLEKERKKASKRLKKKLGIGNKEKEKKSTTITGQARVSLFFQGAKSAPGKKNFFSSHTVKPPDKDEKDNLQHALVDISVRLKLENPTWNAEKCNREALKRLS